MGGEGRTRAAVSSWTTMPWRRVELMVVVVKSLVGCAGMGLDQTLKEVCGVFVECVVRGGVH